MNSSNSTEQPKKSPLFEFIRYTEIKRLVNQVSSRQLKEPFKTISILSEFQGEGKTFFVSTLALSYAVLLQKKVLIIDSTTQTKNRSLRLERIFGKEDGNDKDLQVIDLISGEKLVHKSTESTDFQIGPHIDQFKDQYDLILFDTCALSRANKNNLDPVIIAKHCDTNILLTSQQSVSREVTTRIKNNLDRWEVSLLGTVFNVGPAK